MIKITIEMEEVDNTILIPLINGIMPEKVDSKYVRLENSKKIDILAPSVTRGRAIMNSYIFWFYTVLSISDVVKKYGGKIASGSSNPIS
ncbi:MULTISPECIES: hypothetical protein [Acidianus]|uniref:Uncharacterized protein n=1 Tax=Candidatus Acidianus copahuensis TaxID=1160895 RepID=A0A031LMG8_9CREN|nr:MULTISPECIES: hypothetical protein [Acidianus]EZQ03871.1 hypothetical protein CM19_09130 [Candidatus Acidianus copahuensis]NON61206.1 hypothetical protein [Acidianus sp. RZ1]